jgi:hypothetical protein
VLDGDLCDQTIHGAAWGDPEPPAARIDSCGCRVRSPAISPGGRPCRRTPN